jgi:gliding motility-associated-like protein
MYTPTIRILIGVISLWLSLDGHSQCDQGFANLIGSVLEDEKGYSLTASPDGKYIYVGGIKKDSAVIIKVSVSGQLEWTRTFDVVPGKQDHIHRLFMDSEGMIGVAGTAGTQTSGGSVFAFRYNPDANTIQWTRQYVSSGNNYCLGMIELQSGGNYLLSTNPQSPNVAELVELERTTGDIVAAFSKQYDMGSSEAFYDFTWNNGMLYACGRFSDGGTVAEMRNTLARINTTNGTIDWMKLGHRNAGTSARLYGFDLVIVDDFIYSMYSGDDDGASVDDTEIYMQKSDLQGNVLWIKQYDFPGANDWGDEVISSDNGLVILGRNRVSPSDMYLFKTDTEGNILWSYTYDFFANDNATPIGSVQSQLIEADQHLFFTAFTQETGPADMILVKAGLDGRISDTCLVTQSISPKVKTVANPVFYDRLPSIQNYLPQQITLTLNSGISSSLSSRTFCATNSTQVTNLTQSICAGDLYEGYGASGIYADTFQTGSGCDSIRILELEVLDILTDTVEAEICPGEDYDSYTKEGWYTDTLITPSGCDSIRTVHLLIAEPSYATISGDVCDNNIDGYHIPGTYTDTLISAAGCDSIRTLILSGVSKYIPNVFSPNQDSRNDIFEVVSFPENDFELAYFGIFDRMGNMAYQVTTGPIHWDGRDKSGRFYNPGVFAYVLRYLCNNREITETGNITLIR